MGKAYHSFDVTTGVCTTCGLIKRRAHLSAPNEYSMDGKTFSKVYINCKPKTYHMSSTRVDGRDTSKLHKWEKINASQSRCRHCNILKSVNRVSGLNVTTYQDDNSVIHTEYVECTGKPDNSEFYK